jgi:hypothetical protein
LLSANRSYLGIVTAVIGSELNLSALLYVHTGCKINVERTADGISATGEIDFFGDEDFTRVSGAGGQNRTGYARLFRAALYQ